MTIDNGRTSSAAWKRLRARARRKWKHEQRPCARCGGVIDYDAPRGVSNAFVLGHVIDYVVSGDAVPTLDELQPECQTCSAKSGGATGARRRAELDDSRVIQAPTTPFGYYDIYRRWTPTTRSW